MQATTTLGAGETGAAGQDGGAAAGGGSGGIPGTGPFAFVLEFRLPSAAERAALAAPFATPAGKANGLLGAGLLAAWVGAYWDTWAVLASRWNADPNYSHGFIVPLVSLYLAAQAAQARPAPRIAGGWLAGGLTILFGAAIGYMTVLFPSIVAEGFSMLTVLAGGILLVGGRGWFARLAMPVAFLAFMVPWPSAVYSRVAFPLQLFVCQVAAESLDLCGITVVRDGTLIHLPRATMHVAEACSGLRQLTAFLAICTCAMLLLRRPAWFRATLFLSAVPIAVLVNVVRVTATGLLLHKGLGSWTEGSMHTVEGLVGVALGLALLCAEVKLLDWVCERPAGQDDGNSSTVPAAAAAGA